MGFVPVTGTAVLKPGDPPREGVVEFTDDRRTVALPIRTALPILTKAHALEDLHPSVRLLTSSALLGLRLVAAGRIEPADSHWRVGPLSAEDEDRVRAAGRATSRGRRGGRPGDAGRDRRRDATRAAPATSTALEEAVVRPDVPGPAGPAAGPAAGRPRTCRSSCGSRCGSRPTRRSWSRARSGWSSRCTTSRTRCTSATPRCCGPSPDPTRPTASATAPAPTPRSRCAPRPRRGRCWTGWPSCGCPTRSPSTPTSWSACSRSGVAALAASGVDVLWPRSLGRDLTATAVLDRASTAPSDNAARDRPVRPRPDVQLPVAGRAARRPADRGGAGPADPVRGADPQAARQLDGHRPGRRPQGAQAADPDRRSRAGRRRRAHRHGRGRPGRGGRRRAGGRRRRRCSTSASGCSTPPAASRSRCPPRWPARCATTSARGSPGWSR